MKINQKVLAAVLTIVALAAGQRAMAETKTVTYTITSAVHNSTTNNYDIVFTRSGAAFNTSAPTNFSTSVSSSSIGNSPGNSGSFLVSLADGFKINVSWESGSNVGFDNNYISPGANGKGGPLEFFTVHADRTRLRWLFEVTKVKVNLPDGIRQLADPSSTSSASSPSSPRYFSHDGQQLSRPPHSGIYLVRHTTPDGHCVVRKMTAPERP